MGSWIGDEVTNHYRRSRPMWKDYGVFWRCRHGAAPDGHCPRCAVWHPWRFLRSLGPPFGRRLLVTVGFAFAMGWSAAYYADHGAGDICAAICVAAVLAIVVLWTQAW